MPEPMKVHEFIRCVLSHSIWWAPHEVLMELHYNDIHCSPEAVTARIRDLRKDRYGHHDVQRRRRAGTTYYEYRIELSNEHRKQEAA